MAKILIIQPDSDICALQHAIPELVDADVEVVQSGEPALAAVDQRIPDLILLHAFVPPADIDYLTAYLRMMPDADHVQMVSMPVFGPLPADPRTVRSVLGGLRRQRIRTDRPPADPRAFAEDVVTYLARARAIREENKLNANTGEAGELDRRRAYRWSPAQLRWLPSVRLASGATADLINVSASGTLVRTTRRPQLSTVGSARAEGEPDLTFRLKSGEEMKVSAHIIRCRPWPARDGVILYQVAFRFDNSLGDCLPSETDFARESDTLSAVIDRMVAAQGEILTGLHVNRW